MGIIGTQNEFAGNPLQGILQSRSDRNGLYNTVFNISLHLFCDFILSKKVKKNCKSSARVFFKNAYMTNKETYEKHVLLSR